MSKPDVLIIDGRAFTWHHLCELRRQQLEAWREGPARQLALFELHKDCRPDTERTASGRYQAPTMLDLMRPGDLPR